MKDVEEGVAAALGGAGTWIAVLEAVHGEMRRAAAAIEPAAGEVDPEVNLERLDRPTEVRAVLGNVAESLRPSIEDLRSLTSRLLPR